MDLTHALIVSVQANTGEPLNTPETLTALAQSALMGGAHAVRMANVDNIAHFKACCPQIPVIGITKPMEITAYPLDQVYITPGWVEVKALMDCGTDIVAMDATLRPRPSGETLAEIVRQAKAYAPEVLLMADVDTLDAGQHAAAIGFDWVSTTLSGYTLETQARQTEGPDYELLKKLVNSISIPVLMEGRVWQPHEVTQAFNLGAYAVVVGSAITRPHHITARFVQAIPQ